jgi:hypothetical protein
MVAPEYLHLSGVAIPITFWGGIALAVVLICAAAIVALRGEAKSIQETTMNVADVGYNVALVAAITTIFAAIRRSPRTAIIACAVAWAGIGIDYWFGPPRGFIFDSRPFTFQDSLLGGLSGSPIGWSAPMPEPPTGLVPPTQQLYVGSVAVPGGNISDREIPLDDVYLVSGITGERMNLHMFLYPKSYDAKDLNPVPARAMFLFLSDTFKTPLSPEQFLANWRIITVISQYEGQQHRVTFGDETIQAQMPKRLQLGPHVTPRNP